MCYGAEEVEPDAHVIVQRRLDLTCVYDAEEIKPDYFISDN